jgi:uncharacterized membrane protein
MAHRMKPPRSKQGQPVTYWASLVLACLGTLDAIYLLIFKLTSLNAMCLGSGGCHDVNFSPYSAIHGVPVSALGIAAYVAIAVVHVLEPRLKMVSEYGPLAIFGISLGGVAFTAYLTWLEFHVLHAFCPFCIASAVTITLIFILAVIRLIK